MSFRPRAAAKAESHLTIKEFTGLIQASESQRSQTMSDQQLITALESRGYRVTKLSK